MLPLQKAKNFFFFFLKIPSLFGDTDIYILKQEIYLTYLCRDKQICKQGDCIQDQKTTDLLLM